MRKNYFIIKLLIAFLFFLSDSHAFPNFFQIDNEISSKDSSEWLKADNFFKKGLSLIQKRSFEKAKDNLEKALEILKDINDDQLIGDCYNKLGTISLYQLEYFSSLHLYEKSLIYYNRVNSIKGLTSSYNNIGVIYYYLGNYSKTIFYYKKVLKLSEGSQELDHRIVVLQNIGGLYIELDDLVNARRYFNKAKDIATDNLKTSYYPQIFNGLGDINRQLGNYSEALFHLEEGVCWANQLNEKKMKMILFLNLGKLYTEAFHDYETSFKYLESSNKLSDELKNSMYKSEILITKGNILNYQNRHNEAIKSCLEGLEIANSLQIINFQKEACFCLYKLYKKQNSYALALSYYEKRESLIDSLDLQKVSNQVLNMEFEKKVLLDSVKQVAKEKEIQFNHEKEIHDKENERNILITIVVFVLLLTVSVWSRLRYIKKAKGVLQIEKDRSEYLLLNILPEEIADELKMKGYVNAQDFDTASVLFTDFKTFTEIASKLSSKELVEEINICFKAFDNIIDEYKIEKIKTIGDAYMAVGGLSKEQFDVRNIVLAALKMQEFIEERKKQNQRNNKPSFEMRVGVHTGPIVAGIVGVKKFQYDVWGDTVNIASRMEANGEVNKVNISQNTYNLIKDDEFLSFEYRGKIDVKGKGKMDMYFVK